MKFSLIIPTVNEGENISGLLQRIEQHCRATQLQPEIIIVDDDSVDGTRDIARNTPISFPLQVIHRRQEKGLAGAVVCGADAASGDYLVVMDADLSHPPELLAELLAPLAADQADMVIASRYCRGGRTSGWPLTRRLASWLAAMPAGLLTGIDDPLAGFFALRRSHFPRLAANAPGFKIGLDVLAWGDASLRVQEIPFVFHDRQAGCSKMNGRVVRNYLLQLLTLAGWRNDRRSFVVALMFAALAVFLDGSLFTLLEYTSLPLLWRSLASFVLTVPLVLVAWCFTGIQPKGSGAVHATTWLSSGLAAVALAALLRAGILNLPNMPSLTAAGIATAIAFFAGATLCHTALAPLRPEIRRRIVLLALIVTGILLRLVYLGSFELMEEEAYYWNYAQHLDFGYLDHPPAIALLIHAGTAVFGDNEFGVRFGSLLCGLISMWYVYQLTSRLLSRAAGLYALTLAALLPFFFAAGFFATPDAPLTACWAAALYYLYCLLVEGRQRAWLGAGISLGCGLAAKYTIVFLAPAVVLLMLVSPPARRWWFRPQPYLAAGLALLIFSPVIWWNYQHDWASFLFQSQQRLADGFQFSTPSLLAGVVLLLSPVGCAALLTAAGSSTNLKLLAGRWPFVWLSMLVPFAIVLLFSLTREIKLNWTGPVWLAALPVLVAAYLQPMTSFQHRVARWWPAMIVCCIGGYGLFFHYAANGLPGVPYRTSVFLFGWDSLAVKLDDLASKQKQRRGLPPVIVGVDKYQIASGLAFYRAKSAKWAGATAATVTGRHLFGYSALMYAYWDAPEDFAGRDIMVVSRDKALLVPDFFHHQYRQLGNIEEVALEKEGQPIGSYYYRWLRNYQPPGGPATSWQPGAGPPAAGTAAATVTATRPDA